MKINLKKQQALGIAGLALLRNWLVGNKQSTLHVLKEIAFISKKHKNTTASDKVIIKQNVQSGYKIWSKTYDTKANLLIEIEEPIVKSILKSVKVDSFIMKLYVISYFPKKPFNQFGIVFNYCF